MITERFRRLACHQLGQFADRPELQALGLYVALPDPAGELQLQLVHSWPEGDGRLQPAEASGPLLVAQQQRRWLPLRRDAAVIGALRVDSGPLAWPAELQSRLQAASLLLSEALLLDLDQQRWQAQLEQEKRHRLLLVHQMRNPLAALRTFTQLLLRRLDPADDRRELVEHLLREELALDRYLEALGLMEGAAILAAAPSGDAPLLLPPALDPLRLEPLAPRLALLLSRASATAALQGRPWQPPAELPELLLPAASVAEILANLLENAFRYSDPLGALGLWWQTNSSSIVMAVWDSGPAIVSEERQRIFAPGQRGSQGQHLSGSGLGLALARDQARACGGELELVVPAAQLDASLPPVGNAFVLSIPLTRPLAG
jgi:signal transduction histidine kinase